MNDAESVAQTTTGERTIRVTARDESSLLDGVLRHVFHETGDILQEPDAQSIQAPEGEIIGFRAFGCDIADLLGATIAAALNEADSQDVTVLGVEIGRVMSVPDGIQCWGYLTTAPRTCAPTKTLVVRASSLIAAGDRLCAEVVIAIDNA